ncbi:MAG: hypothetical protein V4515_14945 [Chloroflexota bacterium]
MIERIEVDGTQLAALVLALREESTGAQQAADFVREMKAVVEPAAEAARASILSMATSGLHHAEPSLRGTIADHTKVVVHLSEHHPSVAIRTSKTGMPRGFANAPKRLQARRGWRHPVFGTGQWVSQRGKPGWFDDTIARFKPLAERQASRVLEAAARRISDRTKG